MGVLDVAGLTVQANGAHPHDIVTDVEFSIQPGEVLCLVGESGSGKSVTALSLMRLLEFTSNVTVRGTANLGEVDVVSLDQDQLADIRGRRIAMIFQEAMEALNPGRRIGDQLIEAAPRGQEKQASHNKAIGLLARVGLIDPEGAMQQYPHQMSGGMQQRVMIAMALMSDPELLLADEPTTALDVTIQADILTLLSELQRERGMSCIFITHDMGVAAEIADRIAVMYAGRIVEIGPVEQILRDPKHPYTAALLACVPRPGRSRGSELQTIPGSVPSPSLQVPGCRFAPRCDRAVDRCASDVPPLARVSPQDGAEHRCACWNPVLKTDREVIPIEQRESRANSYDDAIVSLSHVTKTYSRRARSGNFARKAKGSAADDTVAVDDVSLRVFRGEIFGLVGESGSGKSTLGRLAAGLEAATGGDVHVDGVDLTAIRGRKAESQFRRKVQVVFQDPGGSIDPRWTVAQAIAEPLRALTDMSRSMRQSTVRDLVTSVGLPPSVLSRRAGEISGGQRQRVAIARAIAVGPDLVLADEPTSALDVSVQGQIVNLLRRLQSERNLTYIFITHNLGLVMTIADRIGVMYLGAIVEIATPDQLLRPSHPYTQMLLDANPDVDHPRRRDLNASELDSEVALDAATALVDRSVGCRFRDRCPRRAEVCDEVSPQLNPLPDGRQTACHFPIGFSPDAAQTEPATLSISSLSPNPPEKS